MDGEPSQLMKRDTLSRGEL